MNDMQIFNNDEFGSVRTVEENGQIWFCGKDVATALGYKDTKKAIGEHCKSGGVAIYPLIDSMGRTQQAKFINEPNLYRLICHSKLTSAERFEKWVFEEVLPAIRKTGHYEKIPSKSTRQLTTDDYIEAARIVARCRNSRLPIVTDLLEQGGFDVKQVEQAADEQIDDEVDIRKLSYLINHSDLSLNELSKLTNICKASLSYYKNGVYRPSPERYTLLIKVLSV